MGQQANGWFSYTTDARLRALSWVSPKFVRWAALLCLALPVIFYSLYFLIFHPMVNDFARRAQANVSNLQYVFLSDPACKVPAIEGPKDVVVETQNKAKAISPEDREILVKAKDFHGRYVFTIQSVILQFLSILGVLFALSAIGRRTSFGMLASIGVLVCLAGGLFACLDLGPTRKTLVEPILDSAITRKLVPDGTVQIVEQIVTTNLVMGITATWATLVGLAVVTIQARDDELTVSVLRQRLSDLRRLTGISAAILILTVVTTTGLVDWSLGLLCKSQARALKPVGDALGYYWGAAATGILAAALIPSYLSWSHDVERFAIREKPNCPHGERKELLASEHLDFSPTASLLTFLTVVMPALTGIFIEALKALTR